MTQTIKIADIIPEWICGNTGCIGCEYYEGIYDDKYIRCSRPDDSENETNDPE